MPQRDPTKQVVLVLGGARSGKSGYAQRLAEDSWIHPLYLATAEALDAEMAGRIARHRRERSPRWKCVEEPLDIARIVAAPPAGRDGILVDCLTLWLSNVLLREGEAQVTARKKALLASLRNSPRGVILVSNEVGFGLVPETELGRSFRDQQGWLNQEMAAAADGVVLLVAGLPLVLKGTVSMSTLPAAAGASRGSPDCPRTDNA